VDANFNLMDLVRPAYAVGVLGIIVEWRAYFQHNGWAFRRWSAMAALLWAGQYILLDAWTAALTMASTALRSILSGRLETRSRRNWAAAGFIVFFVGLTYFSWQGSVSLLPAFAVINTSLALFYLNNRWMRVALLFSSVAWLANDVYWLAWPAILAESVAVVINLRTIVSLFEFYKLTNQSD